MQCQEGTYEYTTSYVNPYEWECRPWTVTLVNGRESWTESIAECEAGSRISGCMCTSPTNEKGCKGAHIHNNQCVAQSDE